MKWLAFVLIFSTLAFAVSPAETHLCPYSTEVFELEIEPGVYSIVLGGEAAEWATLPEATVVSDGTPIPIFLTVPSKTEIGEHKLSFTIRGDKNIDDAASVFVDNCFGVNLDFDREEVSLCKGESDALTAQIKNVGKYRETFLIKSGGTAESSIELEPDQEVSIDVGVESGKAKGTSNVWVEVIGDQSGTNVKKNVVVNTEECYSASIISPSSLEYCEGDGGEAKIRIINLGTRVLNFNTEMGGAKGFIEKSFSVDGGAERQVSVLFEGNPIGKYPVEIEFLSELGVEKRQVSLSVLDCFGFEIEVDGFTACPGEEVAVPIKIADQGAFSEYSGLVANDLDEDLVFEIGAIESKTFQYHFVVPEGSSGEHKMAITVSNEKKAQSKTIYYEIAPGEACHQVSVGVADTFNIAKGSSKLSEITIRNDGRVAEAVTLSSDKEWVFVKPGRIEVEQGGTGIVHLYISPGFEVELGEHKVTFFAVSESGFSASKETRINVVEKKTIVPTGLLQLPKLGGTALTLELIAYFLAGLGAAIVVLVVALLLWKPE